MSEHDRGESTYPYCTWREPFTDTVTPLKTVADLRRVIAVLPDDFPVYIFGIAGYDTVYNLFAEAKTQQCVEHSGKVHEVTGLIFSLD